MDNYLERLLTPSPINYGPQGNHPELLGDNPDLYAGPSRGGPNGPQGPSQGFGGSPKPPPQSPVLFGPYNFGHFLSEALRYAIVAAPVLVIGTQTHLMSQAVFNWSFIILFIYGVINTGLSHMRQMGMYIGQKAMFSALIDDAVFPVRASLLRRFFMWYFWFLIVPEGVAQFMCFQMLVEPGFKRSAKNFRKVRSAFWSGELTRVIAEFLNSDFPDEYDDDVPMNWTRTRDNWESIVIAQLGFEYNRYVPVAQVEPRPRTERELNPKDYDQKVKDAARRAKMTDIPPIPEFTLREDGGVWILMPDGLFADPGDRW